MFKLETSKATVIKGSVEGDSAEQVVSRLVDAASMAVRGMSPEQRDALAASLLVMAILEDAPKDALREPLCAKALCAQCGVFLGEEAKRRAKVELEEMVKDDEPEGV